MRSGSGQFRPRGYTSATGLPVEGEANQSLRPVCLFTSPPEGGRAEVWGESVKAARRFCVPLRWGQWGILLCYKHFISGRYTESGQLRYAGACILAGDLLGLAIDLRKLLVQTLLDVVEREGEFLTVTEPLTPVTG